MTRAQFLYLIPNLFALALSLGVAIYAYTRRHIRGTRAYVWYAGGQTLWILGFIAGMAMPTLNEKIFWEDFQYIGGLVVMVAFPIFAIEYSDYKHQRPKLLFWLSLIFPIIFFLLLATDNLHHLVYHYPQLQPGYIFQKLDYENTPVIYLYAVYGYLISFLGIAFLLLRFRRPDPLYRAQIVIITLGFLIPVAGTVLILIGFISTVQNDPVALTTTMGNLIIAWGLYRFRIFKVAPVGRDKVFEVMVDPVVILNNQNLVVDINRAMLDLLGMKSEDVIGHSAKTVFDNFPIPIKMYTDVSYARAEAIFPLSNKMVYYELSVWPLLDEEHQITGRVYVCHDITAMKQLESDLRGLNQVLEQRVDIRTKELAEAYDTTLEGWAHALELRDKETEGHSRRVTETTLKIARALEIPEEEIVHIHRGALLHDIGKMAIPDDILRKPGPLSDEERAIVQKHPEIAFELLQQIPFLNKALDIPYCHHEKWDGTGYPRGLKGRAIPIAARIFAVADVWDAVQSKRSYNHGWSRQKAIDYIRESMGTIFDPRIVDVFIRLLERGEI